MAQRFKETKVETKIAKVNNIIAEFPGRTAKAIQNKLRDDYHEIYYGREQIPDTQKECLLIQGEIENSETNIFAIKNSILN